jgi:hypothetical protein
MKIAVIIPYFGAWPSYFNLFIKGCKANQWLDVLIFTDCPLPDEHPENIRFFHSSLEHISRLASDKLSATFQFKTGYKLCDLKPFYGKVFEDYLKEYHYWGYGDIDLIYGKLRPFVLPRIEKGYDILSSRKELLAGSFALFRNTALVNNLCMHIPNYLALLKSNKYECLDETAHSNIVWKGGSKLDLPDTSFTKVIAKASDKNKIKASFTTICKEHIDDKEIIKYQGSELTFGNHHLAYYHYVVNKNKPGFKIPKWRKVPDSFYITCTGFYSNGEYVYYPFLRRFRKITGQC